MMENHHTGQEATLMEVTMGMNGVALSHLPRARPSCFNKCLIASAALLVIGLVAAVMGYFFFFAPQCHPDKPTSQDTAKVNQVIKLPGSNSQGTFDIFTASKSAEYFIYGWLRFSDTPGKDVTLSQTSMGQLRNISTQKANKKEMSFFQKIKLVKGSKISLTLHSSCTDSLFHMYEL